MEDCKHVWQVYSTALATRDLMVRCEGCNSTGVISDASTEEWKRAFYAPSKPYDWDGDYTRVKAIWEREPYMPENERPQLEKRDIYSSEWEDEVY